MSPTFSFFILSAFQSSVLFFAHPDRIRIPLWSSVPGFRAVPRGAVRIMVKWPSHLGFPQSCSSVQEEEVFPLEVKFIYHRMNLSQAYNPVTLSTLKIPRHFIIPKRKPQVPLAVSLLLPDPILWKLLIFLPICPFLLMESYQMCPVTLGPFHLAYVFKVRPSWNMDRHFILLHSVVYLSHNLLSLSSTEGHLDPFCPFAIAQVWL